MKIRISKKTKRIIVIYLAILVTLYIVAFQVPKMTDRFEITQVLENGNLEVSCQAAGYIVKDEAICTADATGNLSYLVESETVVKKGTEICRIETEKNKTKASNKKKAIDSRYDDYLNRLSRFELLSEGCEATISGVFSTEIDGWEKYFSIENLENITKEKTEEITLGQLELDREKVIKKEPIFKISSDDKWYIVCWLEKEDARKYRERESVRITTGDATLDAHVYSKKREGEYVKVVFYLNVYFEDFCSTRELDMTIVQSNTSGLIIDNECIIKKEGVEGVYVKTKDGDTYFRPIKVKISNGEQSVIYDSIFVDGNYEQVKTVTVYQEVLRHPEEALEEDMKDN